MSAILQQRRPIQNEVVGRPLADRGEIGEVRLARRRGNVDGSKNWHASNDDDQNQRANVIPSRDSKLLPIRSLAHAVKLNAQTIPANEFPITGLMSGMSDPE